MGTSISQDVRIICPVSFYSLQVEAHKKRKNHDMPNKEHGPQKGITEDLNQRFNKQMDDQVETPEGSRRPLPTPIIRSVPISTAEPTIQMTMTQLRMFIAEAVAQAIPAGRHTKEAASLGEKRNAISFESGEPLDDIQE